MDAKVTLKNNNVEHVSVELSPVEWLVFKTALRSFAGRKEANPVDREIAVRMCKAMPVQEYMEG